MPATIVLLPRFGWSSRRGLGCTGRRPSGDHAFDISGAPVFAGDAKPRGWVQDTGGGVSPNVGPLRRDTLDMRTEALIEGIRRVAKAKPLRGLSPSS